MPAGLFAWFFCFLYTLLTLTRILTRGRQQRKPYRIAGRNGTGVPLRLF
ncbi:hypothetical protein C7420_105197 [Pantoea ananatis]|nr:hypothetical protein C7420_105197 [Pantoea ananatis]